MTNCYYYKDGEKINDIQTLITKFFEANYQLKNDKIYSKEEIQKSTINKILNVVKVSDYTASDNEIVTEFITTPHPGLYNSLGIETKEKGILAPEIIEKNRVYYFIKENLDRVQNISPTENISGLKYDEKLLEYISTFDELKNIPLSRLITLLNEYYNIREIEEKTKDFGTFLHNIISLKIQDKEYSKLIDRFLSDPANSELLGNYSTNDWTKKINEIVTNVISQVQGQGYLISEIMIMTDGDKFKTPIDIWGEDSKISSGKRGLKGKLDLVAVDTSGNAHIFEIKISKTKYQKWDTAKKLTLDWQLALYRQLLGLHINIDQTRLYVIPIHLETLGNPGSISVEKIVDRGTENNSGLNSTGAITQKANKLIPRKVIADYNPDREYKLKGQLSDLLGNQYKIETGLEDFDVEKIVENARKRYEKDKKWIKWNNFEGISGLKKGYIESDTEEEFRKKIKLYVDHVKTQTNRNVSILKDAIISAIKSKIPVKTNSYDLQKDLTINHLLTEYLNDDWDVVTEIPEAIAFGLVVLKNKLNGNINVISLSINQFDASSHIDGKTYGDLEFLKTFLFLNEFKDILIPTSDVSVKNDKIAQIIIYNPLNMQTYPKNCFSKFVEFKEQMSLKESLRKELKLSEKNVASIEDIALYNLTTNLRNFNGTNKEDVERVFKNISDTNLDLLDVEALIEVQRELFNSPGFVGYRDKTMKGVVDFNDPKEVLIALLQVVIASKGQMEFADDYQRMSKYSLGFSDFKSLIAVLFSDHQEKYNKERQRIQGITQGLLWTTPDWVASKDLHSINKIMAMTNQHIGEKMLKASEQIAWNTKKFYKEINFSGFSRNIIGETQTKHENLWLHDINQKVSKEFRTKNPYVLDNLNALEDHEREYLQNLLLIINAHKLQIPDSEIAKLDSKNIKSLMTNNKIKDALESEEYFRMPLIRREEVTRFGDIFTTPGKLWKEKLSSYFHEFNDYIDNRELTKDDLAALEAQNLGFYEMYDVYARQTPEYVAKGIEKHSINYFEWNLDTIAHRIAFSKIRKNEYDKKLPIINSFIWWMKLSAGKNNEDISNQLEYITNQMKLSIFDEPVIDEEFKDFAKVAGLVKAISTPAMLGFKITSLVKEMTIGVFKGISLAATQIYGKDQFTIGDLTKAYHKLMTIDNKFSSEFNLIDDLNRYYRFANMDVNTIAKKSQSDRRGMLRGTGRYLYMCNTIPDYYNRLSIFLAKMIHDGSYEAHSLVDGVFTYDPTKDKRFEYYFKNRDKYQKGNEFIASTNDVKYNQQRQRYLLLQNMLNKEYGKDTFSEKDIINKAYSETERTSMKSFTDMAYGYYDKDAQSQANNTWWGMTWLQFMQFWPGKMKMWFAKPIDEQHRDESPMGKVVQDYLIVDGKKVLQYFKTVEHDDGTITTETTDQDTGDPVMKWEGSPYEGLWYSVVGTLRDVVKLDFTHIKNSEERNRRALFALADAGLIFIMLGIMKAIIDQLIAEKGTDGLSGSLLNLTGRVNNKVLNEYNVWQSTLGAVNTEPVFLSWSKKMSTDIWDSISGDREIMDVMTRNIGAAEVFKK